MKIQIKGPIVSDSDQYIYDFFGIPATSPLKISQKLEEAERRNIKDVTVLINSGGGSVFAASDIYTELRKFAGNVKIQITGIAASAASVIAQAADSEISPTGQFMIHNALVRTEGDYRDMAHTSDFLQKANLSIINAYSAKTGKSVEELQTMMDEETWMTAQEAVEAGFVDRVMFETEVSAVANVERPELVNGMLPPEVIDKMRAQLAADRNKEPVNSTGQKTNEPEEAKAMDLEKLKAEHPELYNQVMDAGRQEGVANERKRIQEIENIAVTGSEDIINKAKFDSGITAAETAMEILKAQKDKGATAITAIKKDAAPLNTLEATPDATPAAKVNEDDYIKNMLEDMGKLKGAK